MGDIESGLQDLVEVIREKKIKSITLPSVGCGLGGLEWNDVRARIENALGEIADVNIIVFEPEGAPVAEKMARNRKMPMAEMILPKNWS